MIKIMMMLNWRKLQGICIGTCLGLACSSITDWTGTITSPAIADTRIAQATSHATNSQVRWIEINLSSQRLYAWEGKTLIHSVTISSGNDENPTPTGTFGIKTKQVSGRMQGDRYDIPDVPYVMYYSGNYAIHGAYWHSQFGTPVSSGCINLPVGEAQWLFNWAQVGTPVVVRR